MLLEKTNLKFNLAKLQTEADYFLETDKREQMCLTHTSEYLDKQHNDKILQGVGSLFSPEIGGFRFSEYEFTVFNEHYRGTYLHEVYETISEKERVGRFRLMKLRPKNCYTWHRDKHKRGHIAIDTDINNMFVIGDKIVRIPQDGFLYVVDTTVYHTFMNASSDTQRVHLVVELLDRPRI